MCHYYFTDRGALQEELEDGGPPNYRSAGEDGGGRQFLLIVA